MILITIELLSARTGKRTRLGATIIANRGDHPDPKRGNYDVYVANKNDATGDSLYVSRVLEKPLRKAGVLDFPRQSYNIWRLVLRALRNAFPEDSGELSEPYRPPAKADPPHDT